MASVAFNEPLPPLKVTGHTLLLQKTLYHLRKRVFISQHPSSASIYGTAFAARTTGHVEIEVRRCLLLIYHFVMHGYVLESVLGLLLAGKLHLKCGGTRPETRFRL
jgi:hypothetical protein